MDAALPQPIALMAGAADPAAPWVILAVVVVSFAAAFLWGRSRDRARVKEALAMHKESEQQQAVQREREDHAYSQHVRLNDLTARKIELESRVLQAQLEAAERDRAAREQHDQYHALMVQKTELEIQSLKLHIREQKKRNEDFSSYDDE